MHPLDRVDKRILELSAPALPPCEEWIAQCSPLVAHEYAWSGLSAATVKEEDRYTELKLSQREIPSGMVTFVIRNKCADQCSFDLEGIKAGAILNPGQSETWTVALAPGFYRFHCDVLPAMMGGLTVTA